MGSKKLPPSYEWPRFRAEFKSHTAFVAYASAVASLLAFVLATLFPDLIPSAGRTPQIIIAVALGLLSAASFFWSWLKETVVSIIGRLRHYSPIHRQAHKKSEELELLQANTISLIRNVVPLPDQLSFYPDDMKVEVAEECLSFVRKQVLSLGIGALSETSFYIARANVDKRKLTIALRDDESILQKAEQLLVIDIDDLHFMGTFEVVERRNGECYAASGEDVDQLWFGHIVAHGEMTVLPHKIAIPTKHGEDRE